MEEILVIIMENVSIWMPAIIAVLGVVVTVLTAINKTKEAISIFKNDKTLSDVYERLEKLTCENEELIRCNKLLLDNITRIRNYADIKNKEE